MSGSVWPEHGGVLDRLGVPTVINGVGPATRLGGVRLHPQVLQAMADVVAHPVRMDALQDAAGRHIAELLGAPAAYVTSGAAAALFLATAALITRGDPARIDQLPDTAGMPDRVVVQAGHRDPYDRALAPTGAELVVIGYPESTHPGELERVLDDRVAAVLHRPGRPGNLLDLPTVAKIAHRRGVPVLVDGALVVPPVARLTALFADGADLVAVSGGKGFRGPQTSGLLLGRPDLIALVGPLHQDMDERDVTWPVGHTDGAGRTPPRHGAGRSMKVGREQIVGLTVAIERYLAEPGAGERDGIAELEVIAEALSEDTSIAVSRRHDPGLDVPFLEIDVSRTGTPVDDLVRRLAAADPQVYVGESEAWRSVLRINPMALSAGDGAALAETLRTVLVDARDVVS